MTSPKSKGECFIVSRLGSDGSPERAHFEKVLCHLIRPTLDRAGYVTRSALDLHTPAGMIGTDVIQHLYDAPLVIADLTGRNPNVYYELAVRHGYKKPVVQIVDRASLPLPFDIQTTRTITYDTSDWNSIPTCLEQMSNQIAAVELNADEVDNPIVQGFDLKTLRDSSKSEDKSLVILIEEMSAMRIQLSQLMLYQREEDLKRRQLLEHRAMTSEPSMHQRSEFSRREKELEEARRRQEDVERAFRLDEQHKLRSSELVNESVRNSKKSAE